MRIAIRSATKWSPEGLRFCYEEIRDAPLQHGQRNTDEDRRTTRGSAFSSRIRRAPSRITGYRPNGTPRITSFDQSLYSFPCVCHDCNIPSGSRTGFSSLVLSPTLPAEIVRLVHVQVIVLANAVSFHPLCLRSPELRTVQSSSICPQGITNSPSYHLETDLIID